MSHAGPVTRKVTIRMNARSQNQRTYHRARDRRLRRVRVLLQQLPSLLLKTVRHGRFCQSNWIGLRGPLLRWNWFYDVAEGDDKSGDEGASSGNVSVDGFDSDAFEGTSIEGITSHIDGCDGIDRLSNTLLGSCQYEAQVTGGV
jgi:hypothetical protein